jgi:uncharacterized protein (DUF58 family)
LNKFIWLLLIGLGLVLSWVAESPALAWTACFFFLLLLISRLIVAFPPAIEAARVVSANSAYPGDKLRVWLRIKLKRPPLCWLMISDTPPPLPAQGEQGLLLGPWGKRQYEISCTLQATRRGYFSLGPLLLRYGDPFGFFEKQKVLLAEEKITVFPALKEMARRRLPQAQASGELLALRRAFEDPAAPAGIREYRPGDSLRRIHWRATAHTGRHQSKVYDFATSLNALLLLNLQRSDYPAGPAEAAQTAELAISLTASLAIHLLTAGQKVGLISNGRDLKLAPEDPAGEQPLRLPPRRSPERPLEILNILARLQLAKSQPLELLLSEIHRELSWGEALFMITPAMTPEAILALSGLEHAGLSVITLVVGDSPHAARTQAHLVASSLPAERIILESDIAGIFS